MMLDRRLLPALFVVCAAAFSAEAQQRRASKPDEAPMSFRRVTGTIGGQTRSWIVAQGPIRPDSGADFERFLKATPLTGETIYFDSTGGSIVGALRLGYALRQARARVAVGHTTLKDNAPAQLDEKRGVCYSSCAYAFLGGSERTVPGGAAYGVHMFWPGDQLEHFRSRKYDYLEIERVHRLSAQLAIYLQKMGVDQGLLDLAARTPPRSAIRILKPDQLRALKIVTGEPPRT